MRRCFSWLNLLVHFLWAFLCSNVAVAYTIIFGKNRDLGSKVVSYDARDLTAKEKVLLGQMITLTPGTITVEIKEDELLIHVLDGTSAKGKMEEIRGGLERLLRRAMR